MFASSGASPTQVAGDLRRVLQVPCRLQETCVEWCKSLARLREVKLPLWNKK